MIRLALALTATTVLGGSAALAQSTSGMQGLNMPGMTMPMPAKKPAHPTAKKKVPAKAAATKPAASRRARRPSRAPATTTKPSGSMKPAAMPGMDHGSMPGMDISNHSAMPGMPMAADPHAGHDMSGMAGMDHSGMPMDASAQTGTALPAGNAPPPPVPTDRAADRVFGAEAMAMGRHHLEHHHGGQNFSQILFNLAEFQARRGSNGYRWDGEAWFGGDINRLFVKSEGEGATQGGIESAEVQALYSRAVGPYFNIQGGLRQDLGPAPRRTYATLGFEGLAPGMFEVEGAAFLSNKGDLLGRLEGYYDQRITERLILQPRAELNFSAQDVPENRLGSGLTNAELGLRLRYEIRREFAPYVGVSWDRKVGDTARFARAAGDDASATSFVVGIRTWF